MLYGNGSLRNMELLVIYEGVPKNNRNCNIARARFVVTDYVARHC
jgi:hypothetical protein